MKIQKSLSKGSITLLQEIWGNLQGVRPIKVLYYFHEGDFSKQEAYDYLTKNKKLNPLTADLMLHLYKLEKTTFNNFSDKEVALYIHIPFCPTRCSYCSFVAKSNFKFPNLLDDYLELLIREIKQCLEYIKERGLNVFTIYIGGGTPTVLNDRQLSTLLESIDINIKHNAREFTVEAGRPTTISDEKLMIMDDNNVTRICINPQSMRDKTLRKINRNHTVDDVVTAFEKSRKYKFNINMDMIVGLPGEKESDVLYTLDELIKLSPEEITVHSLALKRASSLEKMTKQIDTRIFDDLKNVLNNHNYREYYLYKQRNTLHNAANIGYTRSKPCLYNMAMINEQYSILANGAGAVTKLLDSKKEFTRFNTQKDVKRYIDEFNDFLLRKKRWFCNEGKKDC